MHPENPWEKIGALMGAVPEEKRRLIARYAWSGLYGCGCIFGTIFPRTPRRTWRTTRLNFITLARSHDDPEDTTNVDYPVLGQFRTWMAETGLTPDLVVELQRFNDAHDDATPPEELWRRVYDFVSQRAAEWKGET